MWVRSAACFVSRKNDNNVLRSLIYVGLGKGAQTDRVHFILDGTIRLLIRQRTDQYAENLLIRTGGDERWQSMSAESLRENVRDSAFHGPHLQIRRVDHRICE